MPVAKQLLDWATVNVAPDVISRYLSKGKIPPAKPKQKWVTRYHRTHTDNVPSIDEHGLLTHNPNIGKNTILANDKDYHNIWLANNATEIPVLRSLLETSPQDVTTYKVRMPEQWYLDAPRYYMPKGRSNGRMKRQPKDRPRLTDEGKYKIDLVGKDIPPQYLQKLPRSHDDDQVLRDIFDERGIDEVLASDEYAKWPANVRGQFTDMVNSLAKNDYHFLPSTKQVPIEVADRLIPPPNRFKAMRDWDETYTGVSNVLDELPDGTFMAVPSGLSPRNIMANTISISGLPPQSGVPQPAYRGLRNKAGSIQYPDALKRTHAGAISRGMDNTPAAQEMAKHRRMPRIDWGIYNTIMKDSENPALALESAWEGPRYLQYDEFGLPHLYDYKTHSGAYYGHISTGSKSGSEVKWGPASIKDRFADIDDDLQFDDIWPIAPNDQWKVQYPVIQSTRYANKYLPGQINNPKALQWLDSKIDNMSGQLRPAELKQLKKDLGTGPYSKYVLDKLKTRYTAK